MVIDIGGKGIDLDKVQVHPTGSSPLPIPSIDARRSLRQADLSTGLVDPKDPDAKVKFLAAEALRGVGGLLLDNEGNRFADELGHRDYVTGEMWKNGKFPIRLVLNGEASKEIEWHCKVCPVWPCDDLVNKKLTRFARTALLRSWTHEAL